MGGVGSGIKGHRTHNQKWSARQKARTHGAKVLFARYKKTKSASKRAKLRRGMALLHRPLPSPSKKKAPHFTWKQ